MLLVIAVLLMVNMSLGYLLTRQSSEAMISLIQKRMLDISNTAADMLDGDSLVSLKKEDAGTEKYQAIMKTLTYFQDNIELRYIYCIKDMGDGNFVFSVDPTVDDPGEFGSPIVYTDALYQASKGKAAVDLQPYKDAWGTFYSAYSPVFTSDGKVGGIVAVDFDAQWYDQQVTHHIRTILFVGILSLLIGILIVVIVTRRERKRYRVMNDQLNDLTDKVHELVHVVDIEIGTEASETKHETVRQDDAEQEADMKILGEKVHAMQDEIRNHIEMIRKQAYLDALTGIGNKAACIEKAKGLDSAILEGAASFSVVMLDLNGLKQINDNYGHDCGDKALIAASELISDVFGRERVYRIGGDEFIAILEGVSSDEVKILTQRLDDEIAKVNQTERAYHIPLALSKGTAVYLSGEDHDCESVFRRADLAMYDDKKKYYTNLNDRRKSPRPRI